MNITWFNIYKENIINVTYYTNVKPSEDSKTPIPTLFNWEIKNLTDYNLIIQLNFTDPLYVSSFPKKDLIGLKI